jgi:hypothetical protein
MRTRLEKFMAKVKVADDGCWLWTGSRDEDGYGRFRFHGPKRRAHRVSWELHRGEIPDGLIVCHRCDVPGCVNPSHLFVGSVTDNVRDRDAKGRQRNGAHILNGEGHPRALLTVESVSQIRASEESNVALAAKYGVHPSTVSQIKTGRTWKSAGA